MKDCYNLAERFSWTLDYVDSLPMDEINRIQGYYAGRDRAREEIHDGLIDKGVH